MAVPKNRTSRSRRDKRRYQWRLKFKAPNLVVCPSCQELKLPHRVCPSCGFYKGRQVLEVEED